MPFPETAGSPEPDIPETFLWPLDRDPPSLIVTTEHCPDPGIVNQRLQEVARHHPGRYDRLSVVMVGQAYRCAKSGRAESGLLLLDAAALWPDSTVAGDDYATIAGAAIAQGKLSLGLAIFTDEERVSLGEVCDVGDEKKPEEGEALFMAWWLAVASEHFLDSYDTKTMPPVGARYRLRLGEYVTALESYIDRFGLPAAEVTLPDGPLPLAVLYLQDAAQALNKIGRSDYAIRLATLDSRIIAE